VALIVVGLSTGTESVRRLVVGVHPEAVPAGVALAAASTAVLAVLAVTKRRVGGAIPSQALMADGLLSATGALLGLVTVAGTGLTAVFGWWWVDPLAAAAVAGAALAVGLVMVPRGRRSPEAG
jgi:divalent metal cation (Fe/Co/Zn/Cd) transporter